MSDQRKPTRREPSEKKPQTKAPSAKRSAQQIRVSPTGDGSWQLVHPRCALERAEDIEEINTMLDAGESEIAQDELRWLLGGCNDFIEAHRLLGELALADRDIELARGHFGIAFHLGAAAANRASGPLPYRHEANRSFLESGKGLIWSLKQLNKTVMMRDVIKKMLRFDPDDPLGIGGMT